MSGFVRFEVSTRLSMGSYLLVYLELFKGFCAGLWNGKRLQVLSAALGYGYFQVLFAILFLFHWIVVMFYQAVSKWVVVAAVLLNMVYTVFCRLFFITDSWDLSLLEIVWYGSWLTVVIDILLVGLTIYNLYSTRKIRGNII